MCRFQSSSRRRRLLLWKRSEGTSPNVTLARRLMTEPMGSERSGGLMLGVSEPLQSQVHSEQRDDRT